MWTTAGGRFLTPGRGRPWDVAADGSDLAHHLYQAGTAADVEKTVRYLEYAP